jgi:hypothetical protein
MPYERFGQNNGLKIISDDRQEILLIFKSEK